MTGREAHVAAYSNGSYIRRTQWPEETHYWYYQSGRSISPVLCHENGNPVNIFMAVVNFTLDGWEVYEPPASTPPPGDPEPSEQESKMREVRSVWRDAADAHRRWKFEGDLSDLAAQHADSIQESTKPGYDLLPPPPPETPKDSSQELQATTIELSDGKTGTLRYWVDGNTIMIHSLKLPDDEDMLVLTLPFPKKDPWPCEFGMEW